MENLKHGSRKVNIKVSGLVNVYGMKFHDIEGGFGEDKKSMLVKEIAYIHRREFKHINEAINKNRARFTNNIDIVDLKSVDLIDRDLLNSLGFSNSSIANANNIYILSERGYSKLLKILEDDFAWEQYDKLVDGYFQMREQVNSGQAINTYRLSKELQAILMLDEKTLELEKRLEKTNSKFDELPLFTSDLKSLKKIANRVVVELLGGKQAPAYEPMSKKVFSDLYRQVHREFQISAVDEIKRKDLELAKEIISGYRLPIALKNEVELLNNQVNLNI